MTKIKVGWLGYGGHSYQADSLRDDITKLGMQLVTMHEYANADVPYDKDTFFQFIDSVDIIILPARYEIQSAKSVNRLGQAWSQKKACIVSPLPAYMQYVHDGENALVASYRDDFLAHLAHLRDNAELRKKLGENGYKVAKEHLDPFKLTDHFFQALKDARGEKTKTPDSPQLAPQVDQQGFVQAPVQAPVQTHGFVQVIIPHYSPRSDYLVEAVRSSLSTSNFRGNVMVVSSSPQSPEPALRANFGEAMAKGDLRFHYCQERLSFSQANNVGFAHAHPNTTHFLLLNDDAILGFEALPRMLQVMGNRKDLILNPFSNCDYGWLHRDDILTKNGTRLVPAMKIEDLKGILPELHEFQVRPNPETIPAPFCAMYATLFAKEVREKVGNLNTTYKNGGEDLCYSNRAHRLGVETAWTRNAWVFHFGGRSRFASEQQDYQKHHQEDQFNNSLVQMVYGKDGRKKTICIWTGQAYEQWSIRSVTEGGIGGSESSAIRLAQEFTRDGHFVLMAGDHKFETSGGILWMPWNQFNPEQWHFDLFIASRNANCIDERLRASKVVLWVHDLMVLSHREPNNQFSDFHLKKIDRFLALSPWHKQFMLSYHKNIPENKLLIVPNGIHTELFQ